MSATDTGNTCFLKRSINAGMYRDIQDHFFIIKDKFEDNEFIFQNDHV